jgi:hypothetical protein
MSRAIRWAFRARRRRIATFALVAGICAGAATPAFAQADGGPIPPLPTPNPERVAPAPDAPPADPAEPRGSAGVGGPSGIAQNEPVDLVLVDENGNPFPPQQFTLVGVLAEGGEPVPEGINWRIFGEQDGVPTALIAEVEGGTMQFLLNPGRYYLHALYGWAMATTRFVVTPDHTAQTVVLNAGGLRLRGLVGEDQRIVSSRLRFEVWGIDATTGERVLITDAARQEEVLRLSAGRYHVVSYYGTANSVVRADIDVTAGQLTELSLYHQAARVTLKLVAERGGEALANTAWSILTPGGEILFDSIGAFPAVVLAAGDYVAIARHNDLVYEGVFVVENGINRDVEVLAENPIQAAPGL